MVTDNTFHVELIEKELLHVDLKTIDIFPGVKKNLSELNDVSITNLENKYYLLKYNPSLEKWENVTVDIVIDNFLIRNEVPTKVNIRKFRTVNNYKFR